MDAFRHLQKKVSHDGAPQSNRKHGCPCCRKFAHPKQHKSYAINQARTQLKREDRKSFADYR